MIKTFGLIWGQCSAALQKGDATWEENLDDHNSIWLLDKLKKALLGINPKANTRMTLVKAISSLVNTKQGGTESDNKFLKRFKSCIAVIELADGKTFSVLRKSSKKRQ